MPRGPHDEDIDRRSSEGEDHARKRQEEFLKRRFPEGIPPQSEEEQEEQREREKKESSKKQKGGGAGKGT